VLSFPFYFDCLRTKTKEAHLTFQKTLLNPSKNWRLVDKLRLQKWPTFMQDVPRGCPRKIIHRKKYYFNYLSRQDLTRSLDDFLPLVMLAEA